MSGTTSGTKMLAFERSAWASGLLVYPSSSARRRISSRVCTLTASGRDKARETVARCTPAAFATSSIVTSAMRCPFPMSLVGTPDDRHDLLQLAQRRQSAEALTEGARDLPDEGVVERVAVHVENGSLGLSVQRREGGRSVGIDGGEPGLARGGVAA